MPRIVLLALLLGLRHSREATPLAPPRLRHVLTQAHVSIFGKPPSAARLALAEAQVRLEGSGGACHNLGSISAAKGQPWCPAGRQRMAWYPTHAAGAYAYWNFLKRKCPSALSAFDSGDPAASAHALKKCGYFEASEATYANGLTRVLKVQQGPR